MTETLVNCEKKYPQIARTRIYDAVNFGRSGARNRACVWRWMGGFGPPNIINEGIILAALLETIFALVRVLFGVAVAGFYVIVFE